MDIKWNDSSNNDIPTVTKTNENYKELIINIKTLHKINTAIINQIDTLESYITTLQAEENGYLTDAMCHNIYLNITRLIDTSQTLLTGIFITKEEIKYEVDIKKQEKEELESINNKTFVMDGQDLLDALRVTKTNPTNITDSIVRKNNDDDDNNKNYDKFVNKEEKRIIRESYPHNINKKKNNIKKKGANKSTNKRNE